MQEIPLCFPCRLAIHFLGDSGLLFLAGRIQMIFIKHFYDFHLTFSSSTCVRACVYACMHTCVCVCAVLDCEHAKQYHCVQRMLTLSLHTVSMAPVLCFPQEHGNQDARPSGPSRPLVQLPLLSCLSCIPPYSSGTYQLEPV